MQFHGSDEFHTRASDDELTMWRTALAAYASPSIDVHSLEHALTPPPCLVACHIRYVFHSIDANGDQKLSLAELQRALEGTGEFLVLMSDNGRTPRVEELIARMDLDEVRAPTQYQDPAQLH